MGNAVITVSLSIIQELQIKQHVLRSEEVDQGKSNIENSKKFTKLTQCNKKLSPLPPPYEVYKLPKFTTIIIFFQTITIMANVDGCPYDYLFQESYCCDDGAFVSKIWKRLTARNSLKGNPVWV